MSKETEDIVSVMRKAKEEIESLRQRLAGANARIELMGETALNQQKREVMLRDAVSSMMRDKGLVRLMRRDQVERNNDALAATEPK